MGLRAPVLVRKRLEFLPVVFRINSSRSPLFFRWGGWLLDNYSTWSFTDFAVSMFALMFSLYGLAVAAEGAVDKDKAKDAAKRIFNLADRDSKIDPLSDDGKMMD